MPCRLATLVRPVPVWPSNARPPCLCLGGARLRPVGRAQIPAGFAHFAYVNPAAPKGGELRLVSNLRVSTFDKYNPFTIKGNAPAYLSSLMFDSLLVGSHGRNRHRLRPAGRRCGGGA
jgi:hypothetical protein